MGRRDGDRLTRRELESASRRLERKTTDSSANTRLRRLRRREPPSPDATREWAIQEALILEQGHRIWRQPPPSPSFAASPEEAVARLVERAKATPRPPRLLEDYSVDFLRALAEEGNARFLSFLKDRLHPLLQDLRRVAEEALPQIGTPPEVSAAEVGTAEWFDDHALYACLRGRTRYEGAARTVGEYFRRAEGEGFDLKSAAEALLGFRDRGFVERYRHPPWIDTKLKLVRKPPLRAGLITFMGAGAERRLLFRWLEGETD